MKRTLSFEELIKIAKVGDRIETTIGPTKRIMVRTPSGFVWEDSSSRHVELTYNILEGKFLVLPRFVTFEEALKADAEGKIVKFFYKGKYIKIPLNSTHAWAVLRRRDEFITLRDLAEGQWIIED